jgi:hypothetical protein
LFYHRHHDDDYERRRRQGPTTKEKSATKIKSAKTKAKPKNKHHHHPRIITIEAVLSTTPHTLHIIDPSSYVAYIPGFIFRAIMKPS